MNPPPHFLSAFFLISASASLGAFTAGTPPPDLGTTMFVGDSITHGVDSASYRWALHKILVDNGIGYESVGVKTGNYPGDVNAGTVYGNVAFNNEHSSQASARAWEISGRKNGGRFDGSNIKNWLGQDDKKQNGTAYTGKTFGKIDSFYLLIGTNDLLSDTNNNISTKLDEISGNLLGTDLKSGDMGAIADAMFANNADASVTVLSVPCWTTHPNNNTEDSHNAVATYNDKLKTWVDNYNAEKGKNIRLVDVNKGIVDVASGTPFFGVTSMFRTPGSDGLHPNAQGDLLMAGNVAKAQGYAGRTAGQTRKAATEFSTHVENFSGPLPQNISTTNTTVSDDGKLNFGNAGTSSLVATWATDADFSSGFTVDLAGLVVGNGAENGWETATDFQIQVGGDSCFGTLNVNEAYIKWGDEILYSADMSKNADSLRVAYIVGNRREGLSGGFYVWLDDVLIGEALSATKATDKSGVTLSYAGAGTVSLSGFAMTEGAFAPTTDGFSNDSAAYKMTNSGTDISSPAQGVVEFPTSADVVKENLTASGTFNARSAAGVTSGKSVLSKITDGNATHIYANSGAYTGDVTAIVTGGSASAWFGAHNSGDLTGTARLQLTEKCTGGSTVFGAVNAGTVSGDVFVDISAENATFGSFTSTNSSSVVGAYAANITGKFHLQISAGTFQYDVLGGIHSAVQGGNTVGRTEIFINGGTFKSGVYGGGIAGTIGNAKAKLARAAGVDPATTVVVTDGEISGGVYGGGKGDTINGDTAVVVTGGIVSGGVYGGGTSGTINGNTSVTISGDNACVKGTISGGGTGGTISGNSQVVFKDISLQNNSGFENYAGTISGGGNVTGKSTLVLDNVVLSHFGTTLADFDRVELKNRTQTATDSLGGASELVLDAETSLDLSKATDLSALTSIVLGENAKLILDFGLLTADKISIAVEGAGKFSVQAFNGSADMDLSKISVTVNGVEYAAFTTVPDAQAGTVFLGIPEPSTFGLLAGTLALACAVSRRRRSRKA